ncbi:MAG: NYN domain-containing protein [Candidatus Aenigmarchaeota archaeon]|nr:NYN domain-containing protein [Candidatus Aenigmarchaeota archaeon]
MDKTAVFIDNGYLKKVQDEMKIRVDYEKFSNEIVGNGDGRFRTYVYDCPPFQSNPPTPEEIKRKSGFDKFKYNITRLPRFEFRTGRLQQLRDDHGNVIQKSDGTPMLKQKGIDMALGIDVTKLSATKQIQKIIIVAGDSDFIPAIIAAKQEGILVTLYYSAGTFLHDSLYEVCDDRVIITNELMSKCIRAFPQ